MRRLQITLRRRPAILWEGAESAVPVQNICQGISVGAECLEILPEEDAAAAAPGDEF